MVRTVRQGGSEPLGTQMGGGKGRGRGSGHVPSAQLSPLPLPNKGNSGRRWVGAAWYSGKQGGEGLWGWPRAGGGGGASLPLLCPPPRVKAKVIPQPLGEAGLGWEGRRIWTDKELEPQGVGGWGEAPGTQAAPVREGRPAPLWPWTHPPHGPASLLCESLQMPEPPLSLGRVRWGRGKLRPREGRSRQDWDGGWTHSPRALSAVWSLSIFSGPT